MSKVYPSRKFTSCAKRESKTVLQITGEVWVSVIYMRAGSAAYSGGIPKWPIVKQKAETTRKSFPYLLRVSKWKLYFSISLKIKICLTDICHTSAWNTRVKFNKFVPEGPGVPWVPWAVARKICDVTSKQKAIQSYTASNRIWSFFSFVCALKKFSHKQRQC